MELKEVEGKLGAEEQDDQSAGVFQCLNLDVEAALGTTNLL